MSTDRYPFREIEPKWQSIWEERKQFRVTEDRTRPKFYCLEMFPYPSGRIHMGHVRVYAIGDLLARYKWMRGFNVLHPMGWDAFGLPAENAAIEHGVHPAIWTNENIDHMRSQLRTMGISYDWDREVATCDPSYYTWEQLIFIKMLERGLAYRKRSTVNWCPSCQTVLANEQVEDGRCWRCDSDVVTRELDGWFFKITAYAEELLAWCDRLPGWPERVMTMQRNWIGRSEGAEFDLPVAGRLELAIRVFTTRPDTGFGMTYAVLAPDHPLVDRLVTSDAERATVARFRAEVAKESEIERLAADRPKRGLRLGVRAVNPFNGAEIPLFLADYVLMGYGTGAIMAVPGEDQRDWDFAVAHGLGIIETVARPAGWTGQAYVGDGIKINSGFLDGLTIAEIVKRIRPSGKDGHGFMPTLDGKYILLAVRQADAVDVLDARTHDRVRTVPVGSRPDLFDLSPSGRYAFISLRGKPVTGDPHALVGAESGFAVLDLQTWRVVAKVRAEGENSDIHGIATRPSGFWNWMRARQASGGSGY